IPVFQRYPPAARHRVRLVCIPRGGAEADRTQLVRRASHRLAVGQRQRAIKLFWSRQKRLWWRPTRSRKPELCQPIEQASIPRRANHFIVWSAGARPEDSDQTVANIRLADIGEAAEGHFVSRRALPR